MQSDLQQIKDRVAEKTELIHQLNGELRKAVVGQEDMMTRLLTGLLCGGHVLLEGVPGLAKTTAITALAEALSVGFRRIQFTPDLLPADLLGTMIYMPADGKFSTRKGPIFSNLILADEINRAPSKVQSALLEAMQERQVTAGGIRHPLPDPFFVLATQNPVEQEGTYPLPEAQLDRFMFMIKVEYPTEEEEFEIMRSYTGSQPSNPEPVLSGPDIIAIQEAVRSVPVAEHVMRYAEKLVRVTRPGAKEALDFCDKWLAWGAGPRAGLALIIAAKAHALLNGQNHVGCSNVAAVAPPIFRHRIIPNFAAQSEGLDSDAITAKIIAEIPQHES